MITFVFSLSIFLSIKQSIYSLEHRQALDVVGSREKNPRSAVREAPERSLLSGLAAAAAAPLFAALTFASASGHR